MKSSFDTHMEIEKEYRKVKRQQAWVEKHGKTVRSGVWFGIGAILALILALATQL